MSANVHMIEVRDCRALHVYRPCYECSMDLSDYVISWRYGERAVRRAQTFLCSDCLSEQRMRCPTPQGTSASDVKGAYIMDGTTRIGEVIEVADVCTIEEAAVVLKVSGATVVRMAKRGVLVPRRMFGRKLFLRTDVDRVARERAAGHYSE